MKMPWFARTLELGFEVCVFGLLIGLSDYSANEVLRSKETWDRVIHKSLLGSLLHGSACCGCWEANRNGATVQEGRLKW
jgi:hypothetical protein